MDGLSVKEKKQLNEKIKFLGKSIHSIHKNTTSDRDIWMNRHARDKNKIGECMYVRN